MTETLHELRLALRALARRPAFTAAVVATLAVGIGATTALYSVVDAVLLRELPYPEAERLVWLHETIPGLDVMSVAPANLQDWRGMSESFETLGGLKWSTATVSGEGPAERVQGLLASADLLATLGVRPAAGRLFTEAEDRPGAEPVALLGHGLWQRRYGGDPGMVGARVEIDGERRTVVGVLPEDFRLDGAPEVVLPLAPWAHPLLEERGNHPGLWVVGRLAPGVDLAAARTEMAAIARRLAGEYPETNEAHGITALPLREWLVGDVRAPLLLLLGAVGLVLVIACVNVASLMVARTVGELPELGVRVALGAGRLHVLRRFLAEGLALCALGGALGVVLARWSVGALLALAPSALPRQAEIAVDGRVLLFTAGLATLTGLVFGLVPALFGLRRSPGGGLLAAAGGTLAVEGRTGRVLVAVETGVALVLLVGAGLMVRSLHEALRVDPGFDPQGVVTARLSLPAWEYAERSEVEGALRRLREELEALPGVAAASLSTGLPLAGGSEWGVWPAGRPAAALGEPAVAVGYAVTPAYFRTLGIELVAGRALDERDRQGAPRVCVIDERMAERFFPGGTAVGQSMIFGHDEPPLEIVGVARHVRHYSLDGEPAVEPQIYTSSFQEPEGDPVDFLRSPWIAVRAADGAALEPLAAALRARVAELDPDLSFYRLRPYSAVVGASLAPRRFTLTLLGLYAGVALGLTALGLYSVLSYAVARRGRELGVRTALGATPGRLVRQVVGEGVRLAGIGATGGLVGALLLGGVLERFLFGVVPYDPLTLGLIAALLLAVAAAASALPAIRAARTDPRTALRQD